ncbi:MAG TPA: arginine deiminase-related protein [Vicinamibacteria bacterium]|nr:arginine deiminase-related protein [Vicinamibacteria bacterium]
MPIRFGIALGTGVAVLCGEAVRDLGERRALIESLENGGREVLEIDMDQLSAFAGNMLALENREGDPLLAMSERAFSSLSPAQRHRLERRGRLVWSPIPTIEELGGGSVRCMLAEVFLPRG